MFNLSLTTKERTGGSKLFYVRVFLCLGFSRFWKNIAVYVPHYKSSKYNEIFITGFSLNIHDIFERNLTFTIFNLFYTRFIFHIRIKDIV